MSCPYSDEELQEWDGVANPMGQACRECYECTCEHYDGDCPCDLPIEDCTDIARRADNEMRIAEIS